VVSKEVNAILGKTKGLSSWVTIGGYSLLDGANLANAFTTFIVYEDWDKRGAELNQDKIIGDLSRELASVEEAAITVLVPPPIRGLGRSGGFQLMIEDRQNLGLQELQKAAMEVIRAGNSQSGLRGLTTTFGARSPQLYLDINRTKAESLNIPLNNVFETHQAYLGSSFGHLAGYPANPGHRVDHALQLVSCGPNHRHRRSGFQYRPGPQPHGTGSPKHPAPGYGSRVDVHVLSGKTGGPAGVLYLCAFDHPGLSSACLPL
jgi:multidrug efflux pump subunit AcrB